MENKLFKPKSFEEGCEQVIGDCNGVSMEDRWRLETPLFAKEIIRHVDNNATILDYGCGVGRLAKEIINNPEVEIWIAGVDNSSDMLKQAEVHVNDKDHFQTFLPHEISTGCPFDLAYCVYVLQHVPAVEIRTILQRIHYNLKDDGVFIYCSSDFRMAIRYDQPGFFDDRFLGVDLLEEIERYFIKQGELFDQATIEKNPILQTIIQGGVDKLPHPALVYKKKRIENYLAIKPEEKLLTKQGVVNKGQQKLLLHNRLAPGDILVMTNALRDLHKAHPGKYLTDVRSPCPQIFENNPYVTNLEYNESKYTILNKEFADKEKWKKKPEDRVSWLDDIMCIDMHYPLIHRSGECGAHFCEGHREYLEETLGIKIPQTGLLPEIYLNQSEQTWLSPVTVQHGLTEKYWIINAGVKSDYKLKQYPYYQEVVDLLKDKIKFVQIGQKGHQHGPLNGVIDMIGKTNLRELFRLIYKAEGVITCVSLPMHVAAAFRKPCVVIAGAREGTRWELYPHHQFIYVNGCLPCAIYNGCWRAILEDCDFKVKGIPRCMTLIRPEDVARGVERYYEGGVLKYEYETARSIQVH